MWLTPQGFLHLVMDSGDGKTLNFSQFTHEGNEVQRGCVICLFYRPHTVCVACRTEIGPQLSWLSASLPHFPVLLYQVLCVMKIIWN